jgi:hypothetical protein
MAPQARQVLFVLDEQDSIRYGGIGPRNRPSASTTARLHSWRSTIPRAARS